MPVVPGGQSPGYSQRRDQAARNRNCGGSRNAPDQFAGLDRRRLGREAQKLNADVVPSAALQSEVQQGLGAGRWRQFRCNSDGFHFLLAEIAPQPVRTQQQRIARLQFHGGDSHLDLFRLAQSLR